MNRFCALISVLLLPSVVLAELTGSLSGEAAAAGTDSKLVAEPIIHQVSEGLGKGMEYFQFIQLNQTYQNT